MLGLPSAFANAGSVLGVGLLLAFGVLSAFGLHLLSCCATLSQSEGEKSSVSFRSVATRAAPKFATVIDAAVAVKCFGVATSYLIVVGDTMPLAVGGDGGIFSRRSPWIVGALALVAPLAYLEKLDGLKFASALSLGFVVFLTAMIVSFYASGGHCTSDDDGCGPTTQVALSIGTFKTLTIFIFGYTCHQNIFSVVNEIQRPTAARVDSVIATSIGTAVVTYCTVALCGYFTFGEGVAGDVLDNYPEGAPVVTVARVFVATLVALTYPLQCHPARACILSLLSSRRLQEREGDSHLLTAVHCEASRKARRRVEHLVVTTVFLALSLAIALSVTSLTTVLSVVGATGSTTVSYILPGGIYYRLAPPSPKRTAALALFLLGCGIVPTALVLIFV